MIHRASGWGRFAAVFAVLMILVAAATPAGAQSCSFSVSDLSFGSVDLTDNTAYDTQQSYTASCNGGTPGQTLRLCPNLGAGSSGANGSNAPRYLTNGAQNLGFNIYKDAGRSSVWGSYLGGGTSPEILITLDGNGDGSANGSMYGRVFSGQQSLPPGTYTSNFSGAPNASLSWAVDTGADCTAIGGSNATSFSFQASASYVATCTVVGGSMDFGLIPSLASAVDASTSVSATCSASTPYTVGFSDGLAPSGPMQRRMSHGADRLPYTLYKNAGRTVPWGNASGENVNATGSGSSQSYTVYGRIPSQITPPVGTYTDTVLVVVSY